MLQSSGRQPVIRRPLVVLEVRKVGNHCFRALTITQESCFPKCPVTPFEISSIYLFTCSLTWRDICPSPPFLFLWSDSQEGAKACWEQGPSASCQLSLQEKQWTSKQPLVPLPALWEVGINTGAPGFPVSWQCRRCDFFQMPFFFYNLI